MTYKVYVQWAPPEICQRSECTSKEEIKYNSQRLWVMDVTRDIQRIRVCL